MFIRSRIYFHFANVKSFWFTIVIQNDNNKPGLSICSNGKFDLNACRGTGK